MELSLRSILPYFVVAAGLFTFATLFWHISYAPFQFYFAFLVMGFSLVCYFALESDSEVALSLPNILRKNIPIVMSIIPLILLLFTIVRASPIFLMPLAIVVTAFLPGYVLLQLLPWSDLGGLEKFVLSFVLSVPLSSLIFLGVLSLDLMNSEYLAIILFLISLAPLMKGKFKKEDTWKSENSDFHLPIADLLGLGLCAGLFVFSIAYRYPNIAPAGYDIVRWLTDAKLLLVSLSHGNLFEVFYLLQWSQVYLLSHPPDYLFQFIIGFLSFLLVISFYVMSRKFLAEINHRWAIFATIVWTAFSGLGWIYYYQDFGSSSASGSQALNQILSIYNISYWDVGYGGSSWLWLWYRPVTLGFIMFFVLIYLLKNESFDKKSFILISSLAIFALHFSHYPEFTIFAALIFALCLLMPSINLRLNEMLVSLLIGTLASLALSPAFRSGGLSFLSLVVDALIAVGSFLFILQRDRLRISIQLPQVKLRDLRFIVLGIMLAYVGAVVVSSVLRPGGYSNTYQNVPTEYYPILMGVAGILATLSLPQTIKKRSTNNLMVFVLLMVLAFVIGSAITIFGINIVWNGYYERRMIPLVIACASLLAPLGFNHVREILPGKKLLIVAILFIIVLGGTSSTFLSVEYQSLISNENSLSPADQQAISVLQSANTGNTLLTATPNSYLLSQYVPVNLSVDSYREPLWSSQSPEIALNFLESSPTSLFLTSKDSSYLKSNYPNSFLWYMAANEVQSKNLSYPTVMNLPALVSPVQSARNVLVLQNESYSPGWNASIFLSSGKVNYTSALINDVASWSHAHTIIVPDEQTANRVSALSKDLGFTIDNLVVLNYGGYGPLSQELFSSPSWTVTSSGGSSVLTGGQKVQSLGVTDAYSFTVVPASSDPSSYQLMSPYSIAQWSGEGLGSGSVGAPIISGTTADGNNSLRLSIPAGNYSQWQISTHFTPPSNLASYDFVSFSWYGNGDGKQYVTQFQGPGFYFWYSFTDTWNGWKQILLPMYSPNGTFNLNGVQIVKITSGVATWSNVNSVLIRPSATNLNLANPVSIGNFEFLNSGSLQFSILVNGALLPQLPEASPSGTQNTVKLTSEGVSLSPEYLFSNGQNTQTLFGSQKVVSSTFEQFPNSTYRAQISLKIPPLQYNESAYSIEMQLLLPFQTSQASGIDSSSNSIALPSTVNTLPFETSYPVLASYKNGVPLIVKLSSSTQGLPTNIYYVNIYPTSAVGSINQMLPVFSLIGQALYGPLSAPNIANATIPLPLTNGDGLTFQKMNFTGGIRITSNGGYILPSGNVSISGTGVDALNNLNHISKIIPVTAGNFELKGDNAILSGGQGFYSNILLNNSSTDFSGNNTSLQLFFANGTSLLLTGQHLMVNADRMQAVLRQPVVDFNGVANMSQVVAYGNLVSHFHPPDSSGVMRGHLVLQVQYGDNISVATNVTTTGSYTSLQALKASSTESFIFTSGYLVSFLLVIGMLSIGVVFISINRDVLENEYD